MKKKIFLLLSFFCFFIFSVAAQSFDIVIKGGHVIDPKNNIDGITDIAINEGKIVQIAKNIDAAKARQVVDAKTMYVTPGLIDIHAHVFFGTEPDHYLSNGFVSSCS